MVKRKKDAAVAAPESGSGATLAAIASLALPLVQEVVFLADFRCPKCQQRVAEIMSKMDGETQSVVISVLEKKVVLTCEYPKTDKLAGRQLAHWNTWSKISLVVRLFRSSGVHRSVRFSVKNRNMLIPIEVYCMVMRINLDCNCCCRKMRRVLLRMKGIETHTIEKPQNRVMVSGRFIPADVAIKIRKKMNRRVEILEIQQLNNVDENEEMPQPD